MVKLSEVQIARIKMLENEQGQLTAEAVLADAKAEDSPLHDLFDWNADKAAHEWWLECAREIVRSVKYTIVTTTTTIRAPFYTRDPDAAGQGYRSVVALQRDPEQARQAVVDELTRAAGNVTRARHLAVALNLESVVDELLERIIGLRTSLDVEDTQSLIEAQPS